MYLSDKIRLRKIRPNGIVDDFGHEGETISEVEVWARVWGSMGGHRESIETITRPTSTVRIEGYSVVVPPDTEVMEGDQIVSIKVAGREYLSGGLPTGPDPSPGIKPLPGSRLVVRGIQEHRSNKEMFCEVVR